MALSYKNKNGETVNVSNVKFKGQAVKQLRYGVFSDSVDTVWCKPYTLTIEPNVSIRNVKVTRTASDEPTALLKELKNGDVVYHGDILSCEIIPMPGFIQPEEPTICRVEDNIIIAELLSVEPKQYSLNVTYGNGVKAVTVTRQSSPYKGAKTGIISIDDPIYYGDIIYINAEPEVGYELDNSLLTYSVSGNITVEITSSPKHYTFNYSLGYGVSNATFTRVSSPNGMDLGELSKGATICYGDVIDVSAEAITGYKANYQQQYVVDGDLNINVTASLRMFQLTITTSLAGVKYVSVKRTASRSNKATIGVLQSGALLFYGDNLEIDAEPMTGYVLDKNYKYSSVVYDNVVINVVATRLMYSLSKQVNDGVASVTVTKTHNASTNSFCSTPLNSGDAVSYGDVLSVTATPKSGYSLNTYSRSITVSGNVSVSPTAYLTPYKLTITQDFNIASVSVRRTSTKKSGVSTGTLANNADIYYGDVLVVSATAKSGYKLSTLIINGTSRTNGSSITVSCEITVSATSAIKNKEPVLKSISGTNYYNASGNMFKMTGTVENPNGFAVTAAMYINGKLYSTRNIEANGYTTFQSDEDGTTYSTATLRVVFNNSSEMTSSISITPSDFHPQISAGRS